MRAPLPHAYPFRFVDTGEPLGPASDNDAAWQGSVTARISADSWSVRDGELASPAVLAEAIAQAALLLEGGDPEIGRTGFLAGIDGFEVTRLPKAGDTLTISVKLAGRFGSVFKFEGEIRSADEPLARGAVLVRKGEHSFPR
jgi:3-hydroxymyristoyl/3-hydroxydecanoyl-(acyl carrier protein) dehydratase